MLIVYLLVYILLTYNKEAKTYTQKWQHHQNNFKNPPKPLYNLNAYEKSHNYKTQQNIKQNNMLSHDKTQAPRITQLVRQVRQLKQIVTGSNMPSSEALMKIFDELNRTLGQIIINNTYDINLLVSQSIGFVRGVRQDVDQYNHQMGEFDRTMGMYEIIEKFLFSLIYANDTDAKLTLKKLIDLSHLLGLDQPVYVYHPSLIWNSTDRNQKQRLQRLAKFSWIEPKTTHDPDTKNCIYYQTLHHVMEFISLDNNIKDMKSIGQIQELIMFGIKIGTGFVKAERLFKFIQKILGIVKDNFNIGDDTKDNPQKVLLILKQNLNIFIKSWKDPKDENTNITQFAQFCQNYFNSMGLKLFRSQSIQKKLDGVRLISCSWLDQSSFLEWMDDYQVFQFILDNADEKQAFINNSAGIFKVVLKNVKKQPSYAHMITKYIQTAKQESRKSILKLIQKSHPQSSKFQDQIITILIQAQKIELFTQQVFDVIIRFMPKLSINVVQNVLTKLVNLYINSIFTGMIYLYQRCQMSISDALGRICDRRGFDEESIQQKLKTIINIYQAIFDDDINHERLTILIKITDKITFSKQIKQRIVEYLFCEQEILRKSAHWIRTINDSGDIEDIQTLVCSLLGKLTQAGKIKVIQKFDVVSKVVVSLKIFKKLLSFQKNTEYLKAQFKSWIQNCYHHQNTSTRSKLIDCIRHYFYILNKDKMADKQDLFQIRCIWSQLQGMDTLIDILMSARSYEEREDIAELIADIYTGYCFQMREEGEESLKGVFNQIVADLETQYFQFLADDTNKYRLLGTLALIKHLMMATEILGVGKQKPHRSLVTIQTLNVKVFNDTKKFFQNAQRVYESVLPANMTLFQLLVDLCRKFDCHIYDVQLRDSNTHKNISYKNNGLALEELNLQNKKLKLIITSKELEEKMADKLLGDDKKLTQKAIKAFTQIFEKYAIDGKMSINQCVKFVHDITLTPTSRTDSRVTNLISQYDDDKDEKITLENFLLFYEQSPNEIDIWRNLRNAGYRYDFKKRDQKFDKPNKPNKKIQLRTYLNNREVFQNLIYMSKSNDHEISQRSIQLMFRLPSQPLSFQDLELTSQNAFLTFYFLINAQSRLLQQISQNQKSELFQQILAIFFQLCQVTQKSPYQIKSLLTCLKILRSQCSVPNLSQQFLEYNPLNETISSSVEIKLPDTDIIIKMLQQNKQQLGPEQIQILFALQLVKISNKPEINQGINQALTRVFNKQPKIRQIACNYIFLLSELKRDVNKIFEYKPSEQYCLDWYHTLSKIVQRNPNINCQKVYQICMRQLTSRKESFQNLQDLVIFGNLILLKILLGKKLAVSPYQKIVVITQNILYSQSRKIAYQILSELNFTSTIFMLQQMVQNTRIEPNREICPKNKYIGLNNLGSTCYINSVVQMLYWIPEFRNELNSIQTSESESQITIQRKAKEQYKPILKQTQKIFMYLTQGSNKFYDMTNFCKVYRNGKMELINVKHQEDAHQFQHNFLDILETFFIDAGKKDVFANLFKGSYVNVIVCSECQHRTKNQDPFISINLQVRGMSNILESLNKHTKPEQIEYTCESCKKKDKKAIKYMKLSKLPDYLFFDLNRIFFDFDRNIKISSKFQFSYELSLKGYIADDQMNNQGEYNYRLKAAIVHSGTSQSGHYYCYIRINDKWYKFDDKNVNEQDNKQVEKQIFGGSQNFSIYNQVQHSKSAYILCYQRTKIHSHSQNCQKKIQVFPELSKQIKLEKQLIMDSLKVCNDSVFQICIELYNRIKPYRIQERVSEAIYYEGSEFDENLGKYGDLFDLSVTLLRFLQKFSRLSNPALIPQLSRQICQLLYLLPQKALNFITQTTQDQLLSLLCHYDNSIKLAYRHILTKSLHIFYLFNKQFYSEEEQSKHTRLLIVKLRQILEQDIFFERVFQMEEFMHFWNICLECIEPISNYLMEGTFLTSMIDILTIDSQQNEKKATIKVVPDYIARVVSCIVEKLIEKRINKKFQQSKAEFGIKDVLNQSEYEKLGRPELYHNIIKNQYDKDKKLGAVIAQFSRNNQQFSKQMAQIFLKNLKNCEQSAMEITLEYIFDFLTIRDKLKITRMKWILGISQHLISYQNFGFFENKDSNLFNYVSTLYFSQFDKYKPLLHMLWLHSQSIKEKVNTVQFFKLLIDLSLSKDWILKYLWTLPSPVCTYGNYFLWLASYLKKIESIPQKDFPQKKTKFLKKCQQTYKLCKQKATKIEDSFQNEIANYFIIGKSIYIHPSLQLFQTQYKVQVWEHQTYVLKNLPTGGKNQSINTEAFEKSLWRYFVNKKYSETGNNGSKHNVDQQYPIQVQKTMYTLQIQSETSALKIKFNLELFKEQIYLQPGKSIISFPYQQVDFKGRNISQLIQITPLNSGDITWSNRKYSLMQMKENKEDSVMMEYIACQENQIECPKCTLLNDPDRNVCIVCDNYLA